MASDRVVAFGFLQASELVTELRVAAGQAIRHGSTVYDVVRPLREAADSVYHVRKGGEDSVIKRAGAGREAALGNEADLMDTVRGHENVVNLLDRSHDNSQIRMELVPNGMLQGFDVQGAPQAKRIAKGIVTGLTHVHGRRVVHGDLDKKNVFIGGTPEARVAKIADFGSGSSGPTEILKKAAGDVVAAAKMLIDLVQPFIEVDEVARAFRDAVQVVWQEAQAINLETMQSADPAPEMLGEMDLATYWDLLGGRWEAPSSERVQALIGAWAHLATNAWLA